MGPKKPAKKAQTKVELKNNEEATPIISKTRSRSSAVKVGTESSKQKLSSTNKKKNLIIDDEDDIINDSPKREIVKDTSKMEVEIDLKTEKNTTNKKSIRETKINRIEGPVSFLEMSKNLNKSSRSASGIRSKSFLPTLVNNDKNVNTINPKFLPNINLLDRKDRKTSINNEDKVDVQEKEITAMEGKYQY